MSMEPRPRRRLLYVAVATASLVAMGDWLFFGRPDRPPIGWSVAIYTVALLGAVLACGAWRRVVAERTRAGAALVGGALAMAATMLLEPRAIAVLLAIAALWTLALWSRRALGRRAWEWMRRSAILPLSAAIGPMVDVVAIGRASARRPGRVRSVLRAPLRWIVPAALGAVFVGIFAVANPLLDHALHDAIEAMERELERLFERVDLGRVAFWTLLGALAWALLRGRTGFARRSAARWRRVHEHAATQIDETQIDALGGATLFLPPPPPPPSPPGGPWGTGIPPEQIEADGRRKAAFAWRCLLLFNVIFAVQTTLDVVYLFGGASLPEGMTYAEYAHRGAYPLIAAALLAGLFTLAVFRPGLDAQTMRAARRLLVPWIAQSVFLTMTAAWRLWLYVDMFGLTRWRVAAAIWMGLVAVGLLLVVLRVLLERDSEWLLRRTLAAAVATLALCCVPNWEGLIAWHNVRHCREVGADAIGIDLEYLEALGPPSLPALEWLARNLPRDADRFSTAAALEASSQRLRAQLEKQLADWRGWTIRRAWLRVQVDAGA